MYKSHNELNMLNWNKTLSWTAKKKFVAIMNIFDSTAKNINDTIRKNFGILSSSVVMIEIYDDNLVTRGHGSGLKNERY